VTPRFLWVHFLNALLWVHFLYAQLWIHFLYAQYSNSHGLFTSRLDIFIDPRARKIQASTGNYAQNCLQILCPESLVLPVVPLEGLPPSRQMWWQSDQFKPFACLGSTGKYPKVGSAFWVQRDTRMIEDNSPQQTNVLQSIKHTKAPYQVTVTNTGLKIICTKWVEAVPSEAREVYASQASCYPIPDSADRSVSHNSILSVVVTAPFAFSKVCSFEWWKPN